jgi:hypothetical protein
MAAKKERKEKKEKPLERWTVKEMREEALKLGDVHGVHGMNKEELMRTLRKAKGIPEPAKKGVASVRELKAKVQALREARDAEREQGASPKRLEILRRKISRVKKQTRA